MRKSTDNSPKTKSSLELLLLNFFDNFQFFLFNNFFQLIIKIESIVYFNSTNRLKENSLYNLLTGFLVNVQFHK